MRGRSPDHFSTATVERLEFWLPTDAGILPLVLARDLGPLLAAPLPPWGPEVDRARLRIRMPRTALKRGEAIRVYYQAESFEAGRVFQREPSAGRLDQGEWATTVLLDDQPARVCLGGIGSGTVLFFPFQGEIALCSEAGLTPGRHTLRLVATGDGGTYVNLRNESFPRFTGMLESNTMVFDVSPE